MNDFSYITPTRYIFGHGAEEKVGKQAVVNGMSNVLLVYGKGSVVRSGLLDRVKAALADAGVSYVELGGVQPNPTDDKVYEGINLGRKEHVDGVIAVGGGSAIDTAKAIAGGILYDGDFWDFYAGKAIVEEALPIGVVLTIPAAGSEGSGNSVITSHDGKKISLRTDMSLRPKFSCLNPELTFTLPPYQTACGICDMMIHIFERYFSPTSGVEVTDRVAEGLIMAIMTEAPKVMSSPVDYEARANIMWSGTLAHNGLCGTGRAEDWTSHFMEHEVSALYPEVAHGAGLAVMVPAWMSYVAKRNPAKVAQFARRVLGVTEADDLRAANNGIERLREFFTSLGLPASLTSLGVKASDIPVMVSRLHENKGAVIGAYVPLVAQDTTAIYESAL
ncbi:iron-containing alcohol dehydrogenase [Duncaniella freteri]|uniref:iron-containing alcohol dehydrogenase n=1 Tax=Duncaniella freteri TaxID=2530391 RepID=UPI0025777E5A|nr:iron-containing alcohol dehydrogenase [Duncaniella freteri]